MELVVGVVAVARRLLFLLVFFLAVLASTAAAYTYRQEHQQVIIDTFTDIKAGHYVYKQFMVEHEWLNPRLWYEVKVTNGKDIVMKVLRYGKVIWEKKIDPYSRGWIDLPGPGPYEIRLDNTYSLITDKPVEAKIILYYDTVETSTRIVPEETSTAFGSFQGVEWPIILIIVVAAVALIARGRRRS